MDDEEMRRAKLAQLRRSKILEKVDDLNNSSVASIGHVELGFQQSELDASSQSIRHHHLHRSFSDYSSSRSISRSKNEGASTRKALVTPSEPHHDSIQLQKMALRNTLGDSFFDECNSSEIEDLNHECQTLSDRASSRRLGSLRQPEIDDDNRFSKGPRNTGLQVGAYSMAPGVRNGQRETIGTLTTLEENLFTPQHLLSESGNSDDQTFGGCEEQKEPHLRQLSSSGETHASMVLTSSMELSVDAEVQTVSSTTNYELHLQKSNRRSWILIKVIAVTIAVGATCGWVVLRFSFNPLPQAAQDDELATSIRNWTEAWAVCQSEDKLSPAATLSNGSLAVLEYLDFGIALNQSSPRWCTPRGLAAISIAVLNNTLFVSPPRVALSTLFFATNGANWNDGSFWLSNSSMCTWHGVECSNHTAGSEVITGLSLSGRNVIGTPPEEIFELSSLRRLTFKFCELLGGTISSGIGRLTNLEELDLEGTGFTGTFPAELMSLTSLKSLTLGGPNIVGPFPDGIGNLTNLQNLMFRTSSLKGEVPTDLRFLTNLELLYLFGDFEADLSAAILSLPNLSSVWIGNNPSLTTDISDIFTNKTNWVDVIIEHSGAEGTISSSIGASSSLRALVFFKTHFIKGTIPTEIGECTSLEVLDVDANSGISGTLPSTLQNLVNLRDVSFSYTGVEGSIPEELVKLTNLEELVLVSPEDEDGVSNTIITGTIPRDLCLLESLQVIEVACGSTLWESCPEGCCECAA